MSRPLLTASEVRNLLERHGVAPRRARGQNFVVDPNTVRKVVRDAGVQPGDLVCEIGPGVGSLTVALLDAGARVVAVEVDAGLVAVLADVLAEQDAATIVHADALQVDYRELVGDEPARLVANLPYNIATHLVLDALSSGVFATLFVMVQREVGERWAARVGHPQYGAVSVKIAALADARVAASVSRRAFFPVPNVDSVTVRIVPRPWTYAVDRDALFALVTQGFRQRRKRLRNALAAPDRAPARVEDALASARLDPGARAEELDLTAWLRLAAAL